MPFVMDYTAPSGTNYPESYWVIKFQGGNDPNKNGHIVFFGYENVGLFDAGYEHIAEHRYDLSTPAIYDAWFGQARYAQPIGFYSILENAALALDNHFAAATRQSFVKVTVLEVGSVGHSKVVVTFADDVFATGDDFTTGVTIWLTTVGPTVPATITGAVRSPSNVLTYTITEAIAMAGEEVGFSYDPAMGLMMDEENVPLQTLEFPLPNQATDITLGEYLRFDEEENSAWLAIAA